MHHGIVIPCQSQEIRNCVCFLKFKSMPFYWPSLRLLLFQQIISIFLLFVFIVDQTTETQSMPVKFSCTYIYFLVIPNLVHEFQVFFLLKIEKNSLEVGKRTVYGITKLLANSEENIHSKILDFIWNSRINICGHGHTIYIWNKLWIAFSIFISIQKLIKIISNVDEHQFDE